MIPAVKRQRSILEALQIKGLVQVSDLSQNFAVTEKTIREDLEKLERKGLLKRIHGGAVPVSDGDEDILPDALSNKVTMLQEKRQIAKMALTHIQAEDIIALDSGSTTLEMAKLLPNQSFTVITNDLFIIREIVLKDQIQLVVPGGYRHMNVLIKNEQEDWVQKLNIHKLFLSTMGVHQEDGFTIFTEEHADMKRALIQSARHIYCLADHSKFDKSALFTFAGLDEVDEVIVDEQLSEQVKEQYRSLGLKVLKADQTL